MLFLLPAFIEEEIDIESFLDMKEDDFIGLKQGDGTVVDVRKGDTLKRLSREVGTDIWPPGLGEPRFSDPH